MRRHRLKYLILAFPFLTGSLVFMFQAHAVRQSAPREQTTQGVIYSHEAWNHNRFGYKFQVGGLEYTGWEIPMTDPRLGQTVKVFYDSINPKINAAADFDSIADNRFGMGIVMLIISAVIISAVLFSSKSVYPVPE